MNILLLGSGGREHAIAWKLSQSKNCENLFIAPGNGGTGSCGTNVNIGVNDFPAIETFVRENNITLVVVGPEDPLVNGIVDFLADAHAREPLSFGWQGVIGPDKYAAQLEGSKAFAKEFMLRHHIPTAAYEEFTAKNFETGKEYLQMHSLPVVLKADGLAAGKGVVICQTHAEAVSAFEEMIVNEQFGAASSKVVVEQFLSGIEVSVFILTDGKDYQILGHAKDYKRIGEGDTGLNTGGMGCVTPVPFMDDVFMEKVRTRIIEPTINGFASENFNYNGFVFFGLIKVGDEPYVIEYNCRMGDPETEVVLPLLETDLLSLFINTLQGDLAKTQVKISNAAAATVVAVSGGYPGNYVKNIAMTLPADTGNTMIFHAGTKLENGNLLTNGGRVLAVTSTANTMQEAVSQSMDTIAEVKFEGKYYRSDIGYEFA